MRPEAMLFVFFLHSNPDAYLSVHIPHNYRAASSRQKPTPQAIASFPHSQITCRLLLVPVSVCIGGPESLCRVVA